LGAGNQEGEIRVRTKTFAIFCFLGLLPVCLALAGCNGLENAYKAIELGKPFDSNVIPKSASVWVGSSNHDSNWIMLGEYHHIFFPAGYIRYLVTVHRDDQGKVVRVEYQDLSATYWLLFITTGDVSRERVLTSDGKDMEKTVQNEPFEVVFPFMKDDVFFFLLATCIGGANPEAIWGPSQDPNRIASPR
jgi:hypothetical protein